MRRRQVIAEWLAERDGYHTIVPATLATRLTEADIILERLDRLPLWTVNDVAKWTGLRSGTISGYQTREQMPQASVSFGRVRLWEPDDIKEWRPQGYPHAKP